MLAYSLYGCSFAILFTADPASAVPGVVLLAIGIVTGAILAPIYTAKYGDEKRREWDDAMKKGKL